MLEHAFSDETSSCERSISAVGRRHFPRRNRFKGAGYFEIPKEGSRKFHRRRAIFARCHTSGIAILRIKLSILARIFLWRGKPRICAVIIPEKAKNQSQTFQCERTFSRSPFQYPCVPIFSAYFLLYRVHSSIEQVESSTFADDGKIEIDLPVFQSRHSRPETRQIENETRSCVARRWKRKCGDAGAKRRGWWSRRLYFISYAWNFWIPRVAVIAPQGGYDTSLRGSLHSLWIRIATGRRNRDISAHRAGLTSC